MMIYQAVQYKAHSVHYVDTYSPPSVNERFDLKLLFDWIERNSVHEWRRHGDRHDIVFVLFFVVFMDLFLKSGI